MNKTRFSDLAGYLSFLILVLAWFITFLLMQTQGNAHIVRVGSLNITELGIVVAGVTLGFAILWFAERIKG